MVDEGYLASKVFRGDTTTGAEAETASVVGNGDEVVVGSSIDGEQGPQGIGVLDSFGVDHDAIVPYRTLQIVPNGPRDHGFQQPRPVHSKRCNAIDANAIE